MSYNNFGSSQFLTLLIFLFLFRYFELKYHSLENRSYFCINGIFLDLQKDYTFVKYLEPAKTINMNLSQIFGIDKNIIKIYNVKNIKFFS